MARVPIRAVIVPRPGTERFADRTVAAVRAQGRVPEQVLEAPAGWSSPGAELIWLLDAGAVPEPGALEALLAAAPAPVLASRIPGGDPWPRWGDKAVEVDAAARGLVAIRAARSGSLLIERAALAGAGLLESPLGGPGADLAMTARLLRDEPGYLVPGSRAARLGDAAPGPALAARVRMLAGDTWRGPERLWFAWGTARAATTTAARRSAA